MPSSGDDGMTYKVRKLSKVTKEMVVAALRPLGVLGLIPKDQAYGEPDGTSGSGDYGMDTPLLDQVELQEGGEYIAIYGETSLDDNIREHLAREEACS